MVDVQKRCATFHTASDRAPRCGAVSSGACADGAGTHGRTLLDSQRASAGGRARQKFSERARGPTPRGRSHSRTSPRPPPLCQSQWPGTAELIEHMGALAGEHAPAPANLRAQRQDNLLQAGRTCYRHFAGELGQQVLHAWRSAGFGTRDWQLTSTGREWAWASGLGLGGRRALVRPCVDWTERVDHAAGIFPDEFAGWAFESALVTRGSHERSAVLTDAGRRWLAARR